MYASDIFIQFWISGITKDDFFLLSFPTRCDANTIIIDKNVNISRGYNYFLGD